MMLSAQIYSIRTDKKNINLCTFYFSILLSIAFSSCTFINKENQQKDALAKVEDTYLYASDIKDIVPKGTSHNDSIALVKNYINNWIRETLIIKKAEANLTDEQKNVEKQLQDYRNSLITYAYEQALVNQMLDTLVKDDEIETYYTENSSNFELKDNIIKVLYIKVSNKAPNIEKLKQWYKSESSKDRIALESYCHQFAENFYLDDNTWLLFNDLLKEIPIETYNKELFLKNNRFIEVKDSTKLYLVNIKGFKIKNSLSPLAFEKENIRNIILNKRKLELINKMKNDLYEDAASHKKFEIY